MPELPDVEIYKRYMDSTSLNQRIENVEVNESKVLDGISKKKLQDALQGHSFKKTLRHGKNLFAMLEKDLWLRLHFGMTGYLEYYKKADKDNSHRRVVISFDNGYHLAYVNQRLLGKVNLVKNLDQFLKDNELGMDALKIKVDEFKKRIHERKGAIKSTLMNQQVIAGIGNIYVDEILFQEGIHPKTKADQLNDDQLETLFHKMKDVLNTAIDKEADPDKMPDSYLLSHRSEDEGCPKCKGKVKKIKVSGRNGYYCPSCQKG
jgi:formamidopyrimidine-DNA glycosylase